MWVFLRLGKLTTFDNSSFPLDAVKTKHADGPKKNGDGVIEEIDKINKAAQTKLNDIDISSYPDDNEMNEENEGNEKRNAIRNRKWLWHTRDIAYTFHQGRISDTKCLKMLKDKF